MVFWSKKVEPPQENKEPSMEETSSNLADIKFHDNEPSFVTRPNPPISGYPQGSYQPEQITASSQNSFNSKPTTSSVVPPPVQPQREVFLQKPAADGIMAGPANPPKIEERPAPNTNVNMGGGIIPPPLRPADLRSTNSASPVQLNTGAQKANPAPKMPPPIQSSASNGGVNIPPPPLKRAPETSEQPAPAPMEAQPRQEEPPKPKLKSFSFGSGVQASKKTPGVSRLHWKYRFIGAAMVMVAVAVAVPFIFDSEPPAPSITIPLTIPSENGADTAPIHIPGALVQKVEEQHKADQEKAKKENEKDLALAEQPKSPELDEKTAESPKGKDKPADAKKAEETRKADDAKKVEEARKAEEAKIAAAKKAEADKKKAEEAKKAAEAKQKEEAQAKAKAAKGTYYIQLIATSDAKKINSLASMAKSHNVPYYVEQVTVKSGKVTRFRLGPFKSLKDAENARAKLGLAGIKTPNPAQVK